PLAEASHSTTRLVGDSSRMAELRAQIAKLARSQAPVYISGESGAGKEVAARLMHEQGPRVDQAFVPVNCGAIPSELMESEFFGHVKGSFTGAVADKQGLFEAADGGTLFLDEVADLPLSMQVKLLRSIQEKTIRPVGSPEERAIDVRILSATHKDLNVEVAQGRFRQDLYYRLNVIELAVPSLRDRPSDIPELANQILKRLTSEYGSEIPEISTAAMSALQGYAFPGNVRELENVLERAFTLCEGVRIESADLQLGPVGTEPFPRTATENAGIAGSTPDVPLHASAPATPSTAVAALQPGQSLEDYLEVVEKELIVEALEATRWNKTAAARKLGITFRALRYRLQKLDLE
ncbi:MAG: sigma-54 interaction domain-containing protein, partial [Pseudomonadales bacterium]